MRNRNCILVHSTDSLMLYNLSLRIFQHSIGHSSCYIKMIEGTLKMDEVRVKLYEPMSEVVEAFSFSRVSITEV